MRGFGCPKRSFENSSRKSNIAEYNKKTQEKTKLKFFEKAKELNLDISKAVFTGSSQPIILGCQKHGFFTTTPRSLFKRPNSKNNGCLECKKEKFNQKNESRNKFL